MSTARNLFMKIRYNTRLGLISPSRALLWEWGMSKQPVSIDDIPTSELLKLENQLCFPLYACSKEVVRRYTPHLDKIGLTYTQYLVMMALWEYGDLSVGEMGEKLYLDSGTLTPLLKKMEVRGLIKRVRSDVDGRRVVISLTDEGAALKERAREVPLAMGQCVNIDAQDAADLVRLLRKVMDNIREP